MNRQPTLLVSLVRRTGLLALAAVATACASACSSAPEAGGTTTAAQDTASDAPGQNSQVPASAAPAGSVHTELVRPIQIDWIAPPTLLTTTQNPQVCAAHTPVPLFDGLACEAAIEDDDLMLVWNWADATPPSYLDHDVGTPSGYKVYASFNGGAYTLWATQSSGGGFTEDGVVAPTGIQSCFRVTSYQGSVESTPSNSVCTTGVGNPVKTVILPWTAEQTFETETNSGDSFTLGPIATPANQVNVGYGYEYFNNVFSTSWDWYNTEGAVLFDTSSLDGQTILTATLQFDPKGSTSCLDAVSLASQYWVGQTLDNALPAAGTQIASGLYGLTGSTITADVTSAVRGWTSGSINLGLLLSGKYTGNLEGNGSYFSGSCDATYGDLSLVVTYL